MENKFLENKLYIYICEKYFYESNSHIIMKVMGTLITISNVKSDLRRAYDSPPHRYFEGAY